MGVISEAIDKLVGEYVRDCGLVLWFDPERHYEAVVRNLSAGQEQLLLFDGSFYKLRLEAEPFLRGLDPPKLLVYLPVSWRRHRNRWLRCWRGRLFTPESSRQSQYAAGGGGARRSEGSRGRGATGRPGTAN